MSATVMQVSTVQTRALTSLAIRVRGEYSEMPGLRLTVRQASRLFSLAPEVADAVLHELHLASVLARSDDGVFALVSEPSRRTPGRSASEEESVVEGALSNASLDRLVCLIRHWTWADEAKARFDQDLARGWYYDSDPMSDHPFGAYYHWCALLCGFCEAALNHGLLSPLQLQLIRPDLEASLPGLIACRQLLVDIPASLEKQPRIVDLLHDGETLPRLRRVHDAFGEALRQERMSRAIDSLDP